MQLLFSMFPNPEADFPLIAVVLGLPLFGAFVNGLFGKRLGPSAVHTMAIAMMIGSFAASVMSFAMLFSSVQQAAAQLGPDAATPHVRYVWNAWRWFAVDSTVVNVSFTVDSLSAVMMLVVTGVGGLIHLYSVGYMAKDPGYHRFFAYLNLFIFSMLVLVLGDNLPVLFVGWEGVGLCSYLLIGFWFDTSKNAAAGKKAFIANRIGDFGLLVAMAMLLHLTGTLSFSGIEANASALFQPLQIWPIGSELPSFLGFASSPVTVTGATLIALALFLGCAGKSAQIPLYVWLPDAMAGPTPVSALIHAATMVTAGVYLVARMSFVFALSPVAMMVVAGVGALTALFAATIGLVQNDLKKVLAYSTVSQLGFMFMGVGVGAFASGMFHVVTHAFFKACLFLGAGSVIHAMHARVHDTDGSQDMRNMGGLRKYMPYTFWTYVAATAAIVGLPLTSGFFSKDDILFRAFVNRIRPSVMLQDTAIGNATAAQGGQPLSPEAKLAIIDGLRTPDWFATSVFVIGVTAAILTAFYMTRTVVLTFFGDFRGWRIVPGWAGSGHDDHGAHEDHAGAAHGDSTKTLGPGGCADLHADSRQLQGPVPHESPWTMCVPLVVLGVLALFAGWLNAGPFHITTFSDWIEPVVSNAGRAAITIRTGEELTSLEHRLLVPGVLAFVVGTFGAYWFYYVKRGQPARALARQFNGLYRLVLDKWRIDELYEATVIGAFHAIAEAAAWFDKWVVDGLLARVTAGVIRASGSVLRLFQTGRVQTYAAIMVVGLLGLGLCYVPARAKVQVIEEPANVQDRTTSVFKLEAAPGFGYSYRWDRNGDGTWDTTDGAPNDQWTSERTIRVTVRASQSTTVRLEVRNVFGLTSSKELLLENQPRDGSSPELSAITPDHRATEVAQ